MVQDSIPGGQWFENGFSTPQKFHSHSEHRAALAANGMEIVAKWAGENDRHLKRWDIPCAYTLEKAKESLAVRYRKSFAPEEDLPTIDVTTVSGPVPEGVQHG